MLNELNSIVKHDLTKLLSDPSKWESLIINRRKPFTYRAFTYVDKLRVSLHRFEECDESEAFVHPHPWPGAFLLVKGSYDMKLGYSKDRVSPPENVSRLILNQGARYEITSPLTWHSVTPLSECWTIMVNGDPWPSDFAHKEVRTTRGKDLEKMSPQQLLEHLQFFEEHLNDLSTM